MNKATPNGIQLFRTAVHMNSALRRIEFIVSLLTTVTAVRLTKPGVNSENYYWGLYSSKTNQMQGQTTIHSQKTAQDSFQLVVSSSRSLLVLPNTINIPEIILVV